MSKEEKMSEKGDSIFKYIDIDKLDEDYKNDYTPKQLAKLWIQVSHEFMWMTERWFLEVVNWLPNQTAERDGLFNTFKDVVLAHAKLLVDGTEKISFEDICKISKPLDKGMID